MRKINSVVEKREREMMLNYIVMIVAIHLIWNIWSCEMKMRDVLEDMQVW